MAIGLSTPVAHPSKHLQINSQRPDARRLTLLLLPARHGAQDCGRHGHSGARDPERFESGRPHKLGGGLLPASSLPKLNLRQSAPAAVPAPAREG